MKPLYLVTRIARGLIPCATLALCLGAALPGAQTPGAGETPHPLPQGAPQATPSLRVTTRLVQVSVIVHDKKGEPVSGLTKDDFILLDAGKPQNIATFSQAAGRLTETPQQKAAANIFSNRFDQTGQYQGSVTIILFDALNTTFLDQAYARQEVVKFLRQLHPEDHVAIYILTTRLKVLLEFTEDTSALMRALNQFQGYSSPALDASSPQTDAAPVPPIRAGAATSIEIQRLQEFLDAAEGQLADFYNIRRAEMTSDALVAIANHVARIPGRKNLIWVSGSFPIAIGMDADSLPAPSREMRSFGPEIERAARALNDANMAIYPVDARGLMPPPQFSAEANRGFDRGNRSLHPGVDPSNFFTMEDLADRTGGRAFYNTNDIQGAIRRALSDGQANYEIGYYPNHGKWDGKFHQIKLKLNKIHLQVHYRKGYFATPDPVNDFAQRKAALEAVVISPIESIGLSLRVQVNRTQPADSRVLELNTWLDLRELDFREQGGRWKGALELQYVQRDAKASVLETDSSSIEWNFERKRYEGLLSSGIILTRHLPIEAGATELKILVRDDKSGAIGSVTIPLKNFALE